jgi:hypothetical protein
MIFFVRNLFLIMITLAIAQAAATAANATIGSTENIQRTSSAFTLAQVQTDLGAQAAEQMLVSDDAAAEREELEAEVHTLNLLPCEAASAFLSSEEARAVLLLRCGIGTLFVFEVA